MTATEDGIVQDYADFLLWLKSRSPWNADATLLLEWAAKHRLVIISKNERWHIAMPRHMDRWPDGVVLPNLFIAIGDIDFEAVARAAKYLRGNGFAA